MKPTYIRRYHPRTSSSRDGVMFKKENNPEHSFFGDTFNTSFFQPSNIFTSPQPIQRKCAGCEKEDKKVSRKTENEGKIQLSERKEEEKPIQKISMKDEDEEKPIQKKERKEGEEDPVQMKERRPDEEEKVQKKDSGVPSPAPASSFIRSLSGKGDPLPVMANAFFSSRMGYNFSDVKVHTGKEAADSAKELNAHAYTIGNNIVFNKGQYCPDSAEGKKLLAHELTHVMQQNNNEVKRQSDEIAEPLQEEILPPVHVEVEGSQIQNTTHNADCNGVSVSGSTQANYSSSAALSTRPTRAKDCDGCPPANCVTINSTVLSRFNTAPVVTLPQVPGGLNPCERKAVRAFINGTLNQHEQQHVAAFNAYRGTVSTPISFTGCMADLQAEVQNIHDNVEVPRRQASDAASALLDANGANVFNITCDCPDPAS
jgi:hypothetical protein